MTLITANPWSSYQPHAKQDLFHREAKRFASLACGSRAGKTVCAGYEFIRRINYEVKRGLNFYNKRPIAYGLDGFLDYWLVAPTFPIGIVQRRMFFHIIGGESSPLITRLNKSERVVELYGKARVQWRTTNRPERMIAEGLNGIWNDETARMDEEAWLGGESQRIADRAGFVLNSSTPMGMNWYYYTFALPAWGDIDTPKDPDYSCRNWFTIENTTRPELADEVARQKTKLPPAYFKREYEGSFDAFVGQIYSEFNRSDHVKTRAWFDEHFAPDRIVEVRYGVDWGYHNPGVILVLKKNKDGIWCVCEERVKAEVVIDGPQTETWVNYARDIVARHGHWAFFCDPSEPGNIQSFRRAGLLAKKADNDVLAGIRTVANLLHPIPGVGPSLVYIDNCPITISEKLSYRWRDSSVGKEEPVKEKDHTQDSERYALHTKPGHMVAA